MTGARVLACLGGLAGASGVGLSAVAAHRGGAFTGTAATFFLAHAPVLLAIGLLPGNRPMRLAAAAIACGLVLFCGDLLARDYLDSRLFPFAAPVGGSLLILGWLAVAVSALLPGGAKGG